MLHVSVSPGMLLFTPHSSPCTLGSGACVCVGGLSCVAATAGTQSWLACWCQPAVKSLQSCPTLCDPRDKAPPSWDSPGKHTGVGCHCPLLFHEASSNCLSLPSHPHRPAAALLLLLLFVYYHDIYLSNILIPFCFGLYSPLLERTKIQ